MLGGGRNPPIVPRDRAKKYPLSRIGPYSGAQRTRSSSGVRSLARYPRPGLGRTCYLKPRIVAREWRRFLIMERLVALANLTACDLEPITRLERIQCFG